MLWLDVLTHGGKGSCWLQYEGAAKECGKGPSIWDVFTHIPGFEKKTSSQNCYIYLAIDFNCNLVPSFCKHKVVTIFWVATEAWTFSFSNGYKRHESNHQLYRLRKKEFSYAEQFLCLQDTLLTIQLEMWQSTSTIGWRHNSHTSKNLQRKQKEKCVFS
jgi:hypothetical protein